jgi:Fe/S biogenesis protein NfuA
MISFTDAAKSKFLQITEQEERAGQGLRIIVRNGGTYRPEFSLGFVPPEQKRDDDTVAEQGGFNVFMDPESAKYLEGATVDFIEGPGGAGFKIDAPKAGAEKPSGPVAEAVIKVLEEKVNPGLGSHGGSVMLVAIEDGTAVLQFAGGCQGCGMINVTLKEGVEKILKESVPEITGVRDVTDHAAGRDPYQR